MVNKVACLLSFHENISEFVSHDSCVKETRCAKCGRTESIQTIHNWQRTRPEGDPHERTCQRCGIYEHTDCKYGWQSTGSITYDYCLICGHQTNFRYGA